MIFDKNITDKIGTTKTRCVIVCGRARRAARVRSRRPPSCRRRCRQFDSVPCWQRSTRTTRRRGRPTNSSDCARPSSPAGRQAGPSVNARSSCILRAPISCTYTSSTPPMPLEPRPPTTSYCDTTVCNNNYAELSVAYQFQPVAVETHGPMDEATITFISELGLRSRNTRAFRLTVVTFSSESAYSFSDITPFSSMRPSRLKMTSTRSQFQPGFSFFLVFNLRDPYYLGYNNI